MARGRYGSRRRTYRGDGPMIRTTRPYAIRGSFHGKRVLARATIRNAMRRALRRGGYAGTFYGKGGSRLLYKPRRPGFYKRR